MAKRAAERREAPARALRRVSATELAKGLSDVLNRVRDQNETVIVERRGKPVCQLTPVPRSLDFHLSDLMMLLDSLPSPGEERGEAVAQGVAEQDEFEGFDWPH